MAKEGNKSSGNSGLTKGPCADCGSSSGPFSAVLRYRRSGRKNLIRLCQGCFTKA